VERKRIGEQYARKDATCGRVGNGRNPGIGQRFAGSLTGRIEFDKS